MLYCIKIVKSGRYITYCDDCWYEAAKEPIYIFTEEEAREIAKKMKNHYVYQVDIIGSDNSRIFLNEKKNPMVEETKPAERKNIFKLSTKRIYK